MRSPETHPSKNQTEQPVPIIWRPTLSQIVDRLAAGDYKLSSRPANVSPITENLAELIAYQAESYGDKLIELMDESWDRAVYSWVDDYWNVIIDLCTKEQGVSDLGMFVKVYEKEEDFLFQIFSIHVP